jgi:hypothetical protein
MKILNTEFNDVLNLDNHVDWHITLKHYEDMLSKFPVMDKFTTRKEVEIYFCWPKITCLICGVKRNSLAKHLASHDLTVKEYKIMYGLPFTIGLIGNDLRKKQSATTHKRREAGSLNKLVKGTGFHYYPSHLNYHVQEVKEKAFKMRPTNINPSLGSKNGSAKITEDIACKIYTEDDYLVNIAKKYCVSVGCVRHIRSGKSWVHVTKDLVKPNSKVGCIKKISPEKEDAIKLAKGTHREIARKYGISKSQVTRIKSKVLPNGG